MQLTWAMLSVGAGAAVFGEPLKDPVVDFTVKYPVSLPEGWGWVYENHEWVKDRTGFIFGREERSVTLSGQIVYSQLPPAIFGLVWEKNPEGRWKQQLQPWYRDSFKPEPVPAWVLGGSSLATPILHCLQMPLQYLRPRC